MQYVNDLETLVRIPSVSFPRFPAEQVGKSAEAVADLMKRKGLENVEILKIGSAHPYVYGEYLHAPGKPTLLLYAHHDVQPPGRENVWKTPPFEPTIQDGPGGMRMFGRGTADDKAGILVHLSAIDCFLRAEGNLPVNIKLLVEGEEEIGSTHLAQFLETHKKRLQADVLVLTDTMNFDMGVPALTVGLRGMVGLDIELRVLSKTVHSGMWGGPVPDPAMALSKVLATLTDENGEISVPTIRKMIPQLSDAERKRMAALPFDEKTFRDQSGMIDSAKLLLNGESAYSRMWWLPSLNINAVQASSRTQANNIINDTAWAKVTVRVAPGMDPAQVQKALIEHIEGLVPWGAELTIVPEELASPWKTETQHPAFELARTALKKGYGQDAVLIGSGGTIPFVRPFAEALGGAPALLVGVEDPHTNAHGENESLLLSDFKKACVSQVYLFDELSRL